MFVRSTVESSTLKRIGYDFERELLEITFHTGKVFVYESVPAKQVLEFLSAKSKGRYFNQKIRDHFIFQAKNL